MQDNPLRVFPTRSSTGILIDNLDPCTSYWVIATAIGCINRVASSPQLVGVLRSEEFIFDIILGLDQSCTTWIRDDFSTKISDVDNSLGEGSFCRTLISCVANSKFTCDQSDPQTVTYR